MWVAPWREYHIEVDRLEQTLYDCLVEDMPDSLNSLSTHTIIDDVVDISIYAITMNAGQTSVTGDALVEVELVSGSSSEEGRGEGVLSTDSYPLQFEVVLDAELNIIESLFDNLT